MGSESLTLKWGTLKGWELETEASKALLKEYVALGFTWSAAMQADTPEQKAIICKLIDTVDAETIYLDWDRQARHQGRGQALRHGVREMIRFILWILAMLGVRVVRPRVSRLAPVERAGLDPPKVTVTVSTRPGEIGSPTGRTVVSV